MVNQEYEWPNCWIRGSMGPQDFENDPVRQATQDCTWRKVKGWLLFGGNDHICTHPAIKEKAEVEGAKEKYGGIMAGGSVDDFKTFCIPVDMHLTSLGEKSVLVIEAESRDVMPALPAPRKE